MAEGREEDEFKLPLRLWLKKKIDRGAHKGLEWIDKKAQIFKIPWTQKGHPGWENDYEIFKSWARHRGRFDESKPPDYNKLKGNFRCVIHKSEDFKEMKEKSKTDQQTGNYKVFQILPSKEVKAKNENKKRPRSKSDDDTASAYTTSNVGKRKNVSKSRRIQSCSKTISQPDSAYSLNDEASPLSTVDSLEDENLLKFLLGTPEVILQDEENLKHNPVPELNTLDPALNETFLDNETVIQAPDVFFTEVSSTTRQSTPLQTEAISCIASALDPFQDFLHRDNVTHEQLAKILITLSYGPEVVVCQHLLDLSSSLRVLYGDAVKQRYAMEASGRNEEELRLPTWEFPKYNGSNEKISESLKFADLGIVFSADGNGSLFATRLCQSKVWILKNKTKLLRRVKTPIFSYSVYAMDVINNVTNPPCWKIELTVGGEERPIANVHTVKMVLEPFLAPFLENFLMNNNESPASLCYSSDTSIDNVIRMFNDNHQTTEYEQ